MNLPEFELTPYYTIKLPMLGREISYRPYTVGEEIGLLTHVEAEDKPNIIEALTSLLKNCVKQKDIFEDLSLIDFTYILVHVRAKSKGEIIELEKHCSKCEALEPMNFDVIKSLKIENQKNVKNVIELTDTVKLEIGILPATFLSDSIKIDNEGELKLFTLASTIRKVIINDKIYNNLSVEEVMVKVIKKATTTQLKFFVEKVNELASMKSSVDCVCEKCGHKDVVEFDNVLSFLS